MYITTPKQILTKPGQKNGGHIYVTFCIGLVCGIALGYVLFSNKVVLAPEGHESDSLTVASSTKDNIKLASAPKNTSNIQIDTQLPGDTVLVKHIEMTQSGWLAVHGDNNVKPWSVPGAIYLKAGAYDNLKLPLVAGMKDGSTYYAIIHGDNGDHQFNYQEDLPVRNEKGNIISAEFKVQAAPARGD